MKQALCLLLNVVLVAAMPVSHPPNCPQLLSDAQKAIAAADAALSAATIKQNQTIPVLDKEISDTSAAAASANAAYNNALNTYNTAVNVNNKAQNQLQADTNSLNAITTSCNQPVHAPNCADLLAGAKAQVSTDRTTLGMTTQAMHAAKTASDAAENDLSQANALVQAAIANKNSVLKDLQQAITNAINNKNTAVENYAEVAAECSLASASLAAVQVSRPPNCPALLAAAKQAIAVADSALGNATQELNTTIPVLNKAIADATAAHAQANDARNQALNNYNNAVNANNQASTTLQNDVNSLNSIATSCKQPVHAPNCPDLLSAAQQAVAQAQQILQQTTAAMNTLKSRADAANANLSTATANLNAAIANQKSTIANIQQKIADAISAKNTAVSNYAEVSAECQ